MSRDQRETIDAQLRAPRPAPAQTPGIEEQRAGFAALMATMHTVPLRTEDGELAGRRALRVHPGGESRPGVLLYFHGGSFALGSPETALSLTSALVERTGVEAVSLDYRLAPEHPFPAGIEDCAAAYRELLQDHDPRDVVLAGDSAGGAMVVGTLLTARDEGLPMPAAAVLFSPGLDHAREVGDDVAAADPLFTREALAASTRRYLAGGDPLDPLVSPARTADLTGLPPILLQIGTNDILHGDSVRFAERAREAGCDVVLDSTAGVPHVFQSYTGQLDEADRALDRAALFLVQHLR